MTPHSHPFARSNPCRSKLVRAGISPTEPAPAAAPGSRWRLFANTWLVTALNPKGIVFFVAFLPQFITREPVRAMTAIHSCPLPAEALLHRYGGSGGYTDCYVTELPRAVTHPEFVEAFYTTAVFKLERLLLRLFVSRPSTDLQAAQLARGESESFAAWSVEGRAPDQLLLTDFAGRTRSWLMVAPSPGTGPAGTRLYFGSAVVPASGSRSGRPRMGVAFTALLGFHRLYSRVLLRAARSRLSRTRH